MMFCVILLFVFSSTRRLTICALVTGFQTFALPIFPAWREFLRSALWRRARTAESLSRSAERRSVPRHRNSSRRYRHQGRAGHQRTRTGSAHERSADRRSKERRVGKSVSVRVDLGGGSRSKTTKNK